MNTKKLKSALEEAIISLEQKQKEFPEEITNDFLKKYNSVYSTLLENKDFSFLLPSILYSTQQYMQASSLYMQPFLQKMYTVEKIIKGE